MAPIGSSNTNIVRIPSSLTATTRNFFRLWLEMIKPMHRLASKEIEVLAFLLMKRLELSKSIINGEILDRVLLSVETKREVQEGLNISKGHLQVILSKFHKNNIIKNGIINKKYIPNVEYDSKNYKLILLFEFE
jgi:hypothetical protein